MEARAGIEPAITVLQTVALANLAIGPHESRGYRGDTEISTQGRR